MSTMNDPNMDSAAGPYSSAASEPPRQQQPNTSPPLTTTTTTTPGTTREKLSVVMPLALLLFIVLTVNVVGGLRHMPTPPRNLPYAVSSPVFAVTLFTGLFLGFPLLIALATSGLVEDAGASITVGVAGAAVVMPVLFAAHVGSGDVTVTLTWAAPSFWLFFALDQWVKAGVGVTGWLAGVIDRRSAAKGRAADVESGEHVELLNTYSDGEESGEVPGPPGYDDIAPVGRGDDHDVAVRSGARGK